MDRNRNRSTKNQGNRNYKEIDTYTQKASVEIYVRNKEERVAREFNTHGTE